MNPVIEEEKPALPHSILPLNLERKVITPQIQRYVSSRPSLPQPAFEVHMLQVDAYTPTMKMWHNHPLVVLTGEG